MRIPEEAHPENFQEMTRPCAPGEGGNVVPDPENSPPRLHSCPGRAKARRIFGGGDAATRSGRGLRCHSGGRPAAVAGIAGPSRRPEVRSFPVFSHLRGCWIPQGLSQGPDGSANTRGEVRTGDIPRVPSPSFPRNRRNVPHPCTPVPEHSPVAPESTHQEVPKYLLHREKVAAKGIKGFEGIRAIQRQGALSGQESPQRG